MSKSISKNNRIKSQPKGDTTSLPKNFNSYQCRVCKRPHGLKSCRKFLAMNVMDRIHIVRIHKYCQNCLAHDHSKGTCFSQYGCRHCQKFHHTLLHINGRLLKNVAPSLSWSRSTSLSGSPVASKSPKPSDSKGELSARSKVSHTPSLSSLLRQNITVFLPTVLLKIEKQTSYARCLLDSESTVTRIKRKLVETLHLTTITLHTETMCPLTSKSRFDPDAKIEGIFRVDNRISIQTPSQSLKESFKFNFRDLFLADPKFYESAGIDIILGADVYPKVVRDGVFTKPGLPTAQSTIFCWVIYGSSQLM